MLNLNDDWNMGWMNQNMLNLNDDWNREWMNQNMLNLNDDIVLTSKYKQDLYTNLSITIGGL